MTTPDSFIHGVWPQMFLIRVFFGLVIAAAAWTDVRSRRIPNLLLLYAAFPGGFLLGPVFPLRLVLCTLLLYPLFRLRLTGAGDVKLLAVAAASSLRLSSSCGGGGAPVFPWVPSFSPAGHPQTALFF